MITYILNQSLLKFGEYNLLITPTYIDSILDELNIIQFMFYLNYTFSHNDITKIINWNTNKSEIQHLVSEIIKKNPSICCSLNISDRDNILHDVIQLECVEIISTVVTINPMLLVWENIDGRIH